MSAEEILSKINNRIQLGQGLLADLKDFGHVDGIKKLDKKLEQEIKFLEKLKTKPEINPQQINCTNLNYFDHLVQSLKCYQNVSHVLYPVRFEEKTIRIDIVCSKDNSKLWIKIISRNVKSILNAVEGSTEFGSKSILDFADEYLACAQQNLVKIPQIIFDFQNEIDKNLIGLLEEKGIRVRTMGQALDKVINLKSVDQTRKLNLDITTLIAYVSELTNGGQNWQFQERLLTEQAEIERKEPLKPILEEYFRDKELICCETALSSFREILELLGGENEKTRAEEFLKKVTILPDVLAENILNLIKSAQIKERSLKIFAFGVFHEATTVTSNLGFSRSAHMQNISIPVFVHSARALTERKQASGQRI